MISEGSCDTEDWSNGCWKLFKFHILNCSNISQFHCIIDQIIAALISWRLFSETSYQPQILKWYVHFMDKSIGTPAFKNSISISVAAVLEVSKMTVPIYIYTSHWCLAQGLHLKSHQKCSAGIRTWFSADQSSSSTLTESSFLFDPCLIHRGTVMLE